MAECVSGQDEVSLFLAILIINPLLILYFTVWSKWQDIDLPHYFLRFY